MEHAERDGRRVNRSPQAGCFSACSRERVGGSPAELWGGSDTRSGPPGQPTDEDGQESRAWLPPQLRQ